MSELKIERHFAADPETVFAFVTQTEHLLKWWGPEGMTLPVHALDLSKTGPWHSTMTNSDGKRYKVSGEVKTIDEPHSVEFSWAWHDEKDERGHESTVRFEIAANNSGGTVFTLIHSGLKDEESATSHDSGWSSSLKKLERLAA